jgi:hypothetical protein
VQRVARCAGNLVSVSGGSGAAEMSRKLVVRVFSMTSLIVAPMLVMALVAASQTDFCKGFSQGYFVGYRHAAGRDPESVPQCSAPSDKESDWESGFRIGSQQGLDEGRR